MPIPDWLLKLAEMARDRASQPAPARVDRREIQYPGMPRGVKMVLDPYGLPPDVAGEYNPGFLGRGRQVTLRADLPDVIAHEIVHALQHERGPLRYRIASAIQQVLPYNRRPLESEAERIAQQYMKMVEAAARRGKGMQMPMISYLRSQMGK